MPIHLQDQEALDALEVRLRTILPEEYQDHYDDVKPVSMGSAILKYGRDGKVAWDDIWETFCDLAMAGGPPHKGVLLLPGSQAEIAAQSSRYQEVVAEICRGITLVSDLVAEPAPIPGWVRVKCESTAMADWLVRAIVMENISARCEQRDLDLPAGPAYRVEKEIKNVITAIAKTCHYWFGHMGRTQQWEIADLFASMATEAPLIQPALADYDSQQSAHRELCGKMSEAIHQKTGLKQSKHQYASWLGVECPNVRAAIWMMRALVVSNVLARREGTVLFVPVNPASDPNGETVIRAVQEVHAYAQVRKVL